MVQINRDSGKERKIRQPKKWQAPSKPLVPAGPTTVVNVPPGSPGTTIQVPHPQKKGAFISVNVPASAAWTSDVGAGAFRSCCRQQWI